jgi:hypothetical protein
MEHTFTEARCEPTPIAFLNNGMEAFKKTLGFFAGHYNIAVNNFRTSQECVNRISCRIYQRLNYYLFFHNRQLAQSRQAGLKAYWILRYRPLRLVTPEIWQKSYEINTYFAFFIILCEVIGECLKGYQNDVVRSILNRLFRGL